MLNRKLPSSRGWIGSVAATALSLAVVLALVVSSRYITDTFNYYRYQPSETIASFVSRAGMSGKGKFFFYASQPALEGSQDFNKQCNRTETTTAILGCYNEQRIYIYDVRDTRLTGIRTTTAAHEMLHAAYERLGMGEKQKVNRLLEAEFNKLKTDKDLATRMEFYAQTEPGERDNELHSVIGTEVGTLDPELEAYYRQYFTDRAKVVALHSQYKSVFTSLQARADELNQQIKALEATIKSDSAVYNKEADALKSDISAFNARAQRGDFISQADFSSQRRQLLTRVSDLENLRTKVNNTIQEYNQLVTELNGIATQTEDLNRSIDSSLAPAPSL